MNSLINALLLSLLAGLSTTIGSVFSFILKKPNNKVISFIMGFSAGVMILVSFVELLQEGIQTNGMFVGILFFLLGIGLMLLIDVGISHRYEFEDAFHHEDDTHSDVESQAKKVYGYQHRRRQRKHNHHYLSQQGQLRKASVLVTLGVFIHNFPEGIATFIGTLKEFQLGILIAIAIALHNIPEGIAVATTVSTVNDSKLKPFLWSFVSGISEPIGALAVGLFLFPFINNYLLGAMLSIVGGFMVYISLDELLPMSRSLGKEHTSILGIAAGMFVMAISLAIL
ncbi:MAG: zinc transporter ZupT [Candidatus Thorarchaeota archaeon]